MGEDTDSVLNDILELKAERKQIFGDKSKMIWLSKLLGFWSLRQYFF